MIDPQVPQELAKAMMITLGLENTSPEKQQAFAERINKIVEERVAIAITSQLSDEDLKVFDTLTAEELPQFFAERQIDILHITVTEGQALRERLIADMAYLEGQLQDA